MKKTIALTIALVGALLLTACGSSNSSTPACTTTPQYNAYGQLVNNCVNGQTNPYGYNPYGYTGYNTGYTGYNYGYGNQNPCAQYQAQYGVPYYPSNVGGQMMCVAAY